MHVHDIRAIRGVPLLQREGLQVALYDLDEVLLVQGHPAARVPDELGFSCLAIE